MKKDNKKAAKEFGSNFLLNAAEKHFTNPKNKAPTATYIKNKKKHYQRIQNLMDQM